MELKSEYLLTLEPTLHTPELIGDTPVGRRKIVQVSGGTFTGPELSGQILSGGDWALTRNDGTLMLDVRLTMKTDDDAIIYVTYRGMRHGPKETMARLSRGEKVDPADYYFRIQPWFETNSEKYGWLNRIVSVGIGERVSAGPRYTVFQIL